ncbi:MAG: hypothetical protein Fur0043_24490 [Anaerolineales bacterium]
MRLPFPTVALCLAAFMLTACLSPVEAASPPAKPTPSPIPAAPTALPQRAPLLRIATLGDVTTTNVWALFERMDYWEQATQASYWPRLYALSPLSLDPEPAAAKSAPPSPVCDSATCTATVTLRPGLRWSDGSSLTAADVAFTVNTALQFQLGGGWNSAYNPQVLDHAEALSQDVVRFYFKRQPSVAGWQYGALQGPIVNQAYWQPRMAQTFSLLPEESLLPAILELEQKSADMQAQVEALNLSLNDMAPDSLQYQQTVKQAANLQEELNSINHQRDKARETYEAQLASARAALYSLPNATEPTLGVWQFSSRIPGRFENTIHFGSGYGNPWFEKIRYSVYSSEEQAVEALVDNEVDLILTRDGLSPNAVKRLADEPKITLSRSLSRSARFLALNQANPYLAEPALRQALACVVDSESLAQALGEQTFPLSAFVLDGAWRAEEESLPCAGLSADMRLSEAMRLLKSAGYAWAGQPSTAPKEGTLLAPDGRPMPRLTLLTPAEDGLRAQAARQVARQVASFGLEVQVQEVDWDTLWYAVYGSGSYDLALLGWRLSRYPAYLCEWFTSGGQNPFAYNGSRLRSACEAWSGTSNLDEARRRSAEVQSILTEELPLIPLYVEARYDAYRNLRYPFEIGVGGLGDWYGAPEMAIPNP